MDEPVAESSIGNSFEAPRTRILGAVEASVKKVLEPEPSQSTIQALSTATRKRSEAERRNPILIFTYFWKAETCGCLAG